MIFLLVRKDLHVQLEVLNILLFRSTPILQRSTQYSLTGHDIFL